MRNALPVSCSLLFAGWLAMPSVHAQGFGAVPVPQAGIIHAVPTPQVAVPPSATDRVVAAPKGPAPKVAAAKPKKKIAPAPVAHERIVAKNDPRPSFHPGSAALMNEAIARYQQIVQEGDWPILPAGITLRTGSNSEQVIALRQRLAIEGDLAREETGSPMFDTLLARAVKAFQSRHGQSQNGIVTGATLKALRVSARERLHMLEQSTIRMNARNFAFGGRFVVVNIPSASVEAVADGQVQRRYVAVVGKRDRASPMVETRITNVNFNPTWTVPVSIIKKDIIPKMQSDPGYLAKAKIRIYGASGNEVDPHLIDWNTERALAFTLRQDSGAGNSLGQIRIDMPNRESVYMHDTPSKKLFLRDDRFHSSGCVRVENVRDFADWLLDGAGGPWDKATIAATIDTGKRKDVRLKDPVPVIWTYLTGFVTPDGQVHFREDAYGLDDPATVASVKPAGRSPQESAPRMPAPQKLPPIPATLRDNNGMPASLITTSVRAPQKATLVQRIDP